MIDLSATQLEQFQTDGFLVLEKLLPVALIEQLHERFERVFAGKFETGIYPDEWYWRKEMSLPNVTRHMANAWKSDLTIASVVTSAKIGAVTARLADWSGARLGQDTLWWKPPGTKEIALHQDDSFISYLNPPHMMSCWIALDDTSADAGTIEYVRGSHQWPLTPIPEDFHAPDNDYRWQMKVAAQEAGIAEPEIRKMKVKAGDCIIHHGRIWHGSGPNSNATRSRRALGVHIVASHTNFQETGGGYIYGRYKRIGETVMDESFFPILWSADDQRSQWLKGYCEDALSAK